MSDQKPRMIEIKADDGAHHDCEKSPTQDIVCATLDTALRLVRDGAARLVIQSLRDSAELLGAPFPATDEEFVAKAWNKDSGRPAPEVYQFAALSQSALFALETALNLIERETRVGVAQVVQDKIDLESL